MTKHGRMAGHRDRRHLRNFSSWSGCEGPWLRRGLVRRCIAAKGNAHLQTSPRQAKENSVDHLSIDSIFILLAHEETFLVVMKTHIPFVVCPPVRCRDHRESKEDSCRSRVVMKRWEKCSAA